jgi:hypothetical protein
LDKQKERDSAQWGEKHIEMKNKKKNTSARWAETN